MSAKITHFLASQDDYEQLTNKDIHFNTGESRVTYNVKITDDNICESPSEAFFCNISIINGDSRVNITQDHVRIIITDSKELECGRLSSHIILVLYASIVLYDYRVQV